MKIITAHEHELINAVIGEGLTTLAEAVIEKDLLLTEVLQAINATEREGVGLIFCGGTCLSKAHGLINRMSEDIDFKLIVPQDMSGSARRRMLSRHSKRLTRDFEQLGFHVPADQIVARDENSYVCLNLHYKSRFPPVASLRTEIKVELNARPPVLPTLPLRIRSMLSTLTQESGLDVLIECIGVEETLAEKVLSFLRRTAEARLGRSREKYDDRLVRHLYDVTAIACGRDGLKLPCEHFPAMVAGDAAQYRKQYPEFEQDPIGQMRSVMEALMNDPEAFERDYFQFVDELVFGAPVPFGEARSVFIDVAERLLWSLPGSDPPGKGHDGPKM
jgi:predicted nucleotidyltransferase component of viral defense system